MKGERIRSARLALRLTQKQLSEKCGIHRTRISHFERETNTPSVHNLRQLSLALNVPTDWLLELPQFRLPRSDEQIDLMYPHLEGEYKKIAYEVLQFLFGMDSRLARDAQLREIRESRVFKRLVNDNVQE